MSDQVYLTCLAITVISALAYPVCCAKLLRSGDKQYAVIAVIAATLGFSCSLPFQRTQEMPWLPEVAGAYFAAVSVCVILYNLSNLSRANNQRKRD